MKLLPFQIVFQISPILNVMTMISSSQLIALLGWNIFRWYILYGKKGKYEKSEHL